MFGTPLLYLKVAGLLAIAAGAGYIAWTVRGSFAEAEKEAAVAQAVELIEEKLAKERELREHYAKLADDKLARLLKSISEIRVKQQSISDGIQAERRANPEFYEQPLPPGGYEEWMRARALIPSAAASSASSPSP